ncbi:MAG: DUF938 domain-containing protein [Nannocystis sp.]|nr:DUF938 domain-containing protein [Nannocystis sp.]MBA3548471.1 DUF938 domain-containing protein [Nannocystis sp.]
MHKRTSEAALRNRDAILAVLERVLPAAGVVLEIASGSGEHAVAFATALGGLTWQPSERDAEGLASIAAWAAELGPPNLRPAVELDVQRWPWPVREADAIVCINMIHIAPWSACEALLRGAGALLQPGAPLYLYGAMKLDGRFTAPSNADFDASLRARDPSWGVRDLAEVTAAAQAQGLVLEELVPMPANNFSLILRRV